MYQLKFPARRVLLEIGRRSDDSYLSMGQIELLIVLIAVLILPSATGCLLGTVGSHLSVT
jgi:hypothetical protein